MYDKALVVGVNRPEKGVMNDEQQRYLHSGGLVSGRLVAEIEPRGVAGGDVSMTVGLIIAGLVSFAAGFVLHVGAFLVFALITAMLYLLLIYQSGAVSAALASAAALFVIMQIAYVIGVLTPLPIVRKASGRRIAFPKSRVDSSRNK
ncbi:hypothetical protein ACLJYM_00050 [Rhizobium giardinii]|uniref:hypothetical protein n=1 Tax=Rhizobium giardinii TaxID=56731 RepID=UPI0013AFA0BB